jgi:DEAD/DEAH box helicase
MKPSRITIPLVYLLSQTLPFRTFAAFVATSNSKRTYERINLDHSPNCHFTIPHQPVVKGSSRSSIARSTAAVNMDVSETKAASNKKRHDQESIPGEGATKKPRRRNNNRNNNNGPKANRENTIGNGNAGGSNPNRNNRNRNNNKQSNKSNEQKKETMEVIEDSTADDVVMESPVDETEAPKSRHQFSNTTFASLNAVSANSKKALTDVLKFEFMTKVQEATLPSLLDGKDIVAKAKTGSGKTTGMWPPLLFLSLYYFCPYDLSSSLSFNRPSLPTAYHRTLGCFKRR